MNALVDPGDVLLELGLSTSATTEERSIVEAAITKATGSVRSWLRYDPTLAERTEFHPQQAFQAQISRGIWEVMEQRAVLRQVSESATNELQLQHLPIRGTPVVAVRRDYDGRSESRTGSFPDSSILTIGQDFWPNYDCFDASGVKVARDGILRTIGLWPTTPGTVKVVYTSGYSSAELRGSDSVLDASPIWSAALDEAVRLSRKVLTMKKGRFGVPAGVMTSETLGDYNYSMDAASVSRMFGGELMPESKERLAPFTNWGWNLGS